MYNIKIMTDPGKNKNLIHNEVKGFVDLFDAFKYVLQNYKYSRSNTSINDDITTVIWRGVEEMATEVNYLTIVKA